MLLHVSLHGAVLNTAAFKAVKFDLNAPTPAGGMTARKPGSDRSGRARDGTLVPADLHEHARSRAKQSNSTRFEAAQATVREQRLHDRAGRADGAADAAALPQSRRARTALPRRRRLRQLARVPALVCKRQPSRSRARTTNHFRVGGVKIVGDGSPQGKTAFWTKPLLTPGPAGEKDWCGEPNVSPEELNKVVKLAYDNGIQVMVALQRRRDDRHGARRARSRRRAAGNAHGDHPLAVRAARSARLNTCNTALMPSFFTNHTFFWGDVHVENLGKERAYFISPTRIGAQARGMRFTNHSDFAVTPLNPMFILWTLGQPHLALGASHRSRRAHHAARRAARAHDRRRLSVRRGRRARDRSRPGKLADFAILDANPIEVDAAAIKDIKVTETIKEGKTVYRRP